MPSLDWEGILEKHGTFGRLEPEARQALVSRHSGGEKTYPKGTVILREGQIGDSIFIIGEGAVEVVLRRPDRETVGLYTLGEGEIFGEMALLEQRPRSATVVAAKDTTVLEIPGEDFRALMQEQHDLALYVLAKLSQRLRYTDDKILDSRIRGLDETIGELRNEIDKIGNKTANELEAASKISRNADETARHTNANIEQLRSWITWVLGTVGSVLGLLTIAVGVGAYFGVGSFDELYEAAEKRANKKFEEFDSKLNEKTRDADNDIRGTLERVEQYAQTMNSIIEETRWAEALMLANLLDQYAEDNVFDENARSVYNKVLSYSVRNRDTNILKKVKETMELNALKGKRIHQFLEPTIYDMRTGSVGSKDPGNIILTYYFATLSAIVSDDDKADVYLGQLEKYISDNVDEAKISLGIVTKERLAIRGYIASQQEDRQQEDQQPRPQREKSRQISEKRLKLIDRLFDAIDRVS